MIIKHSICFAALSLAITATGGCDEGKGTSASTSSAAKTTATATAKATASATADTTAASDTNKPDDAKTPSQLQEEFKADSSKLLGKKVKVSGVYFSTSKSTSGGKTSISISIIDAKGKTKPSVSCAVAEEPKGLMQYDPIVAEGTVSKMFGAALKDCTFKKL